jgi:hypothetical protein
MDISLQSLARLFFVARARWTQQQLGQLGSMTMFVLDANNHCDRQAGHLHSFHENGVENSDLVTAFKEFLLCWSVAI